MGHHGGLQGAALQRHIGKIHQRLVRQAQRQIEIPQPDVAVHAQHAPAALGQRRADAGSQRGLAGAALAGHHRDALSLHAALSLLSAIIVCRFEIRNRKSYCFYSFLPYSGFFLIFAKALGYFFGVSASFLMKMTR